jgi:hypothetical protein
MEQLHLRLLEAFASATSDALGDAAVATNVEDLKFLLVHWAAALIHASAGDTTKVIAELRMAVDRARSADAGTSEAVRSTVAAVRYSDVARLTR